MGVVAVVTAGRAVWVGTRSETVSVGEVGGLDSFQT